MGSHLLPSLFSLAISAGWEGREEWGRGEGRRGGEGEDSGVRAIIRELGLTPGASVCLSSFAFHKLLPVVGTADPAASQTTGGNTGLLPCRRPTSACTAAN